MNRAQLEQGFAKLVETQRYLAATGVAMNLRKVQVDLEQAMQLIADAVNTEENPERVRTEWDKKLEEVWLQAYARAPKDVAWEGFADSAVEDFEKRFGPKKAEA